MDLNYTFKRKTSHDSHCMAMLSKLASAELSKRTNSLPSLSNTKKSVNSHESDTSVAASTAAASLDDNTHQTAHHEFRRPLSLPLSKQHQAFKQQLENLMPKYNRRTGRRPISRMKRDFSQQRPKMLQPAPMVKSVDGQVKLRLMPNITVTHPIGNIKNLCIFSDTKIDLPLQSPLIPCRSVSPAQCSQA